MRTPSGDTAVGKLSNFGGLRSTGYQWSNLPLDHLRGIL